MFDKPTYEELEQKVRELEKAESERRLEEHYRALSAEVLLILNESADFESSIKRVLAAVRHTTGCDKAAGQSRPRPGRAGLDPSCHQCAGSHRA